MYIRDDLTPIRETELERENIETLWCKIGNTAFGVCYKSTSNEVEQTALLEQRIKHVCQTRSNVLICGDFNRTSINWRELEANAADNGFLDLTQELFITQYVREPTRGKNVLDLVFSKIRIPSLM